LSIEPSNLLVSRHSKVKIADFGLSHVKRSPPTLNGSYGVCGTPCYMAPEVLMQLPYSFKADVFSLGMVLCEMITGEYPLRRLQEILQVKMNEEKEEKRNLNPTASLTIDYEHAIMQGIRPDIPPDAPEELNKLITQCWNQDPDVRPSVEQVMESLSAMEMNLEKAAHSVVDENAEELPEEVKKISHEHQQRMTEMHAALKDCKFQLTTTQTAVRSTQYTLARQRKIREQTESKLKSLTLERNSLFNELESLKDELIFLKFLAFKKSQKAQ
jgi:serine/threonine protein kinase